MHMAVMLQDEPDGLVSATVPAIPGLSVTAPSRELAVSAARGAIAHAIKSGSVVLVDVGETGTEDQNPLERWAGVFADDALWDEFIEEMRAAREREDVGIND